ncbi:MAG: hypothetical protein J0H06_00435 [Actinobacteria bacterium]|nr:hypothetical protein [Actinomycetota bacterium]OJU81940.1 MAG: hypothetical protein BGO11_19010 [Solirubrobacterales bacterium 70-9]
MDDARRRRRRIATLTVVLPLLASVALLAVAHFFGHETASPPPRNEPQRRVGAAPAAIGSQAPRVRLVEGATGRPFDSAALEGTPYAVVFISTRCEAIGGFLARATAELNGTGAAILAISSDPKVDSRAAVRAWLGRHRIATGGSFHYLVGGEGVLRGLWNAWGFSGPSADCGETVPAHLASGTGVNTGIIDLDPQEAPSAFTDSLTGPSP